MSNPLLFVSAGDPSGDIAAARVISVLHEKISGLEVFGLGGARLATLGQEQMASGKDLAVLGFWEVARRFRFFQQLMKRAVAEITARRPKAIVLVDYPGFNLRLAARIRHLGIPIIYYIAPQVWAWGQRRVEEMRKLIDLALVILPFEEKYFHDHGVPTEFVGHYLLEDVEPGIIGSPSPGRRQIALLPGSRHQEIDRMLTPMLGAARLFNRQYDTKAVVAGVSGVYDYDAILSKHGDAGISIQYDNSRRVVADSDLVITASGTATLETGIIARPMVIVYKTGNITYLIARRVITLDRIGLVNLVLDEKVVPELIQREVSPQQMSRELSRYREDESYVRRVHDKLLTLPSRLGGIGASGRAAESIGRLL
jgi:lipid-A-disaccharide synthase